jgi:hypothetical protein
MRQVAEVRRRLEASEAVELVVAHGDVRGIDMGHDGGPGSTPERARTEDERVVTFPLPLRNALAELAIAALDDAVAAEALGWLSSPSGAPPPDAAARLAAVHLADADGLLAVHVPHAAAVAEHASRALRAVRAYQPSAAAPPLEHAARATLALWNERLFFEVHEVLEAVWKTATGATRQVLQGVIQVAVAFHHLAHGNLRGARTLLAEGRARIAGARGESLGAIDLDDLLATTAPWESVLRGHIPHPDAPPRLNARR